MVYKKLFPFIFTTAFVIIFFLGSSAGGDQWIKTELYFGMTKNSGGIVKQDEWDAFEDSVIVKVFSAGSTTIEGSGIWLNENGDVIKEKTMVVISVNKMTPELSAAIDAIREKYKLYFSQSSVLRIDHPAGVSF